MVNQGASEQSISWACGIIDRLHPFKCTTTVLGPVRAAVTEQFWSSPADAGNIDPSEAHVRLLCGSCKGGNLLNIGKLQM